MSDDRMDRAERIRNMREGNRGTDDQTDEASTATDAAGGGSGSAATDDTDTPTSSGASSDSNDRGASTEDTGFSSLRTESDDSTSGTDTGSTASQQSPTEAARTASQAADTVQSSPTTSAPKATGDTASAGDAQAAAQRAAESAAEVMGAGTGPDTATGSDHDPGADTDAGTADDTAAIPTDATGAGTGPGDISGVELPDQQLLEEAMATSSVESTEGGARAAMEGESTQSEEVVRVLEFSLGDEYYCLDIEYVEEIVKRNTVTRVPNTPDFVDGVVDLRGQITTILEPKEMMDIESEGEQNLIIVFDPEQFEDQGAIGWVVDEVRQVVPIPESEVNHPPVDAEYINGVVDRDEYEQFVIWIEPEDALAQATATDEE